MDGAELGQREFSRLRDVCASDGRRLVGHTVADEG